MIDDSFIQAIPKTDLHVHLDGSLRIGTLIELARQHGIALPSYTPEGLHELVFKDSYADLGEYLTGFAYTAAVLQSQESLERAAYELAMDNIAEGVCYLEVRFAPHLHVTKWQTIENSLAAVWRGLERAEREHRASDAVKNRGFPPFRSGIIVCALRMFRPEFSWYYAHLSRVLREFEQRGIAAAASLQLARAAVRIRDDLGIPIVGFDLAGQERGFPAVDHEQAFRFAHEHFMKKTVHAGEAYGPESIFQAITALHADRIGHGYHLFSANLVDGPEIADRDRYVRELSQFIADRRITIEVCITSNLQTNPTIGSIQRHAFRRMMDARLSCTICTDNRLVSHTSVSKELKLAVEAFGFGGDDLRKFVIYGFKRSFFPGDYLEKRSYVRAVIDHYQQVAAQAARKSNHRSPGSGVVD